MKDIFTAFQETPDGIQAMKTDHPPQIRPAEERPRGFAVTHKVAYVALAALFSGALMFSPSMFQRGHSQTAQDPDPNLVGRLPFMGYNTWNAYHCDINASVVFDAAQLIKTLGLADVGYNRINIDDCYSLRERNANGDLVEDPQRFPFGMKNLTAEISQLGLKSGIYSDAGWQTCGNFPGSYQNEARDIKLFQDWGFDFLKYDNCNVPFDDIVRENIIGRYTRMADAIADLAKTSGKPPMILSLCEWGRAEPWLWGRTLGQSWRTTGDIEPTWEAITAIINQNSFYSWAADFYGHNDMDIMEMYVQSKFIVFIDAYSGCMVHDLVLYFPVVVMATSRTTNPSPTLRPGRCSSLPCSSEPMYVLNLTAIAVANISHAMQLHIATNQTLEILSNKELIAINQDPVVGTAITPFLGGINPKWTFNDTHPSQYWSGRSENGTVFMLLNVLDHPADMFFSLTESPWIRAGRQYAVRDLWTHTDNGTAVRNMTFHDVPAHGVVALLLTDAGDEPEGIWPPCARREWCMYENGTLADNAPRTELGEPGLMMM
ncbi:hypothetical protein HGRIS_011251 [Hohenbuehelia grisea]|uniref:Alpha-galactosidase n=1 Tax=Hohenbuehelia grisea TaxID=104357 RepID=A0ABR3JUJ2_9AGAR